jgi:predicted dehydrogenase
MTTAGLRYGVLGTGYWASETHAAALAGAPDATFAGVWGRSPDKAAALAERYAVPSFSSPGALFDAVDAVAIAVPPDVQADLAVRAANAGKHLILDKPVALSTSDADRVVAAVEAADVASLVFFTTRFAPETREWFDELAGTDGAGRGEAWQGAHGCWLGSIYRPGSPYADSAWRRERGALWDVGPHALAAVLPILGGVRRAVAGRGPGDTVHAVLEHESGASSVLSLSLTVPLAAVCTALVVYGERGRSAMPASATTPVHAFGEAISQLGALVADGTTTHPCDVRFGRDVVAVLEQIERGLPYARLFG